MEWRWRPKSLVATGRKHEARQRNAGSGFGPGSFKLSRPPNGRGGTHGAIVIPDARSWRTDARAVHTETRVAPTAKRGLMGTRRWPRVP